MKIISAYLGPEQISLNDIIRFYEKITFLENCCWYFNSPKSKWGYGKFTIYNYVLYKTVWAHRASFAMHKGHISPEYLVRHSCDNSHCVNPDHLVLGTFKDNSQDTISRKRDLKSPAGINRYKTHCANGHEFTLENTYTRNRPGGGRICKACAFIRKGFHYDGTRWRKTALASSD